MGVDPTVSQREICSATQKSKGTGGLVSIVSYSRDCTISPINRFAALLKCAVYDHGECHFNQIKV